jgi:hypothetical protein
MRFVEAVDAHDNTGPEVALLAADRIAEVGEPDLTPPGRAHHVE